MIDFVVEWLPCIAVLMAGMNIGLWIIARHRRKAVDRFRDHLYKARKPDEALGCAIAIEEIDKAGWCYTRKGHTQIARKGGVQIDGPGRVIERSVRRMTKEKT